MLCSFGGRDAKLLGASHAAVCPGDGLHHTDHLKYLSAAHLTLLGGILICAKESYFSTNHFPEQLTTETQAGRHTVGGKLFYAGNTFLLRGPQQLKILHCTSIWLVT